MPLYIKGTDIEVSGILEEVRGKAIVLGLGEDGTLEYAGQTDYFYDEQKPVLHTNGQPIWIDDNGVEYRGVEVEDRREDGTVVAHKPWEQEEADNMWDGYSCMTDAISYLQSAAKSRNTFVAAQVQAALLHLNGCKIALDQVLNSPESTK